MAIETTPLNFGDIALSACVYIDGVPHITKRAIGEWLEYERPRHSVNTIIERNSYIDDYSVALKLGSTDGKNYDTKVYHPIGFLLIVMESSQPKAQQMKAAVAEFVWRFAGPRELSAAQRIQLAKLRLDTLKTLDKATNAYVRQVLEQELERVSLQLGIALPAPHSQQPGLPGV